MWSDEKWRTWDSNPEYGEIFSKRARMELPEMESAKATVRQLSKIIRHGDSMLDVGCGAGHYYTSFKNRLNVPFTYTGVDATKYYVELARATFKDDQDASFSIGDVHALPFVDNHFDLVVCTNLLLHLPGIEKPILELCRVAKRYVVIRTLIGNRSFIVKEVKPSPDDDGNEFEENGEPKSYSYFNIYSEKYIKTILSRIEWVKHYSIREDFDYDHRKINEDHATDASASERTRIRNGVQTLGYLILPWVFLTVELGDDRD